MNITLKNIGIIKDSTVAIDGITVITGKNNSGKSTFGKVIYSVVSAAENLYTNATKDIVSYAEMLITKRFRASDLNYLFRGAINFTGDSYLLLKNVYNHKYPIFTSIPELKDAVDEIINAIQNIDIAYVESTREDNPFLRRRFKGEEELEAIKNSLIEKIYDVQGLIDKYSDFVDYEQRKLIDTLQQEFESQITPVKLPSVSNCNIYVENDSMDYSVSIDVKNHSAEYSGSIVFNEEDNVVFIDDVTVIDAIRPDGMLRGNRFFDVEDFNFFISSPNHGISLMEKLSKRKSIIGVLEDEKRYKEVEDLINSIIKDDIVEKDGEYIFSTDGLSLSNLAMGAKVFTILKMLLMNGSINKNTILILDEPEAHLHPEWQNIFAEIVALLVKEVGLKVIITSHSPNFVLAIQTYSMEYELGGKTKFYITIKDEDDYRVDYKLVDDMTLVYADFAKYFSQIKAKFDRMVYEENDDQ